jgi:hypothetical protein
METVIIGVYKRFITCKLIDNFGVIDFSTGTKPKECRDCYIDIWVGEPFLIESVLFVKRKQFPIQMVRRSYCNPSYHITTSLLARARGICIQQNLNLSSSCNLGCDSYIVILPSCLAVYYCQH